MSKCLLVIMASGLLQMSLDPGNFQILNQRLYLISGDKLFLFHKVATCGNLQLMRVTAQGQCAVDRLLLTANIQLKEQQCNHKLETLFDSCHELKQFERKYT